MDEATLNRVETPPEPDELEVKKVNILGNI